MAKKKYGGVQTRTKQCSNTNCDKRFKYKRSSKKYCSRRCSQDVYRRQQKALSVTPGTILPVTVTPRSRRKGNCGVQRPRKTSPLPLYRDRYGYIHRKSAGERVKIAEIPREHQVAYAWDRTTSKPLYDSKAA